MAVVSIIYTVIKKYSYYLINSMPENRRICYTYLLSFVYKYRDTWDLFLNINSHWKLLWIYLVFEYIGFQNIYPSLDIITEIIEVKIEIWTVKLEENNKLNI